MLRRTLAHHAFCGCNPPLLQAIRATIGRDSLNLQEATDIAEHMPEGELLAAMFDHQMILRYHLQELQRTLSSLLGNVGHRSNDDTTNAPGGLTFNIRAARAALDAAIQAQVA